MTRYGDLRQECHEFLYRAAIAHNDKGMPINGVLDLWYSRIPYTAGFIHPGRVIGIAQPNNCLIVERPLPRMKRTGYSFVDINGLDLEQLVELCDYVQDVIRYRHDDILYRTDIFEKPRDFVDLMARRRHIYEAGERVIWQQQYLQDDGTYIHGEPETGLVRKVTHEHIILASDRDKCDVMECSWVIQPYSDEQMLKCRVLYEQDLNRRNDPIR